MDGASRNIQIGGVAVGVTVHDVAPVTLIVEVPGNAHKTQI